MILGVGTDIVRVARFKKWEKFSSAQRSKLFAYSELEEYQLLLNIGLHDSAAQYLASRFAAKEALYKAFSRAYEQQYHQSFKQTFFGVALHMVVGKTAGGSPIFKDIDFLKKLFSFDALLSITHEKEYAVAFVLLTSKEK